jgi:YesN/AraC family two-component response regulator
MEDKNSYKKLAILAKNFSVLYIEDNSGLQKQASKIFKKFFSKVVVAGNGEEGLEFFKKFSPDIVVSDIKMPKMNGLEMAKKIKDIDSDVKIIITSAFEEKEYLLKSIDIGVTKYLKKPIQISDLIDTLIDVINNLNEEKDKKLFEHYTKDAFEYQDHILIFVEKDKSLVVNKKCLEFFAQENHKKFEEIFENFSQILLPHENFLYAKEGEDWLATIKENSGKLFNVKLKDSEGKNRHFALKAQKIPDFDDRYILSFDDITELGLLEEENSNLSMEQRKEEDKIKMMNLLHVLKRNKTKIKLHNSYKGLSISNTGTIEEVMSENMKVKTTYLQQRAIHLEKKTTIESELFPKALECNLINVNFATQTVELNNFSFMNHLPSAQKYVRVMPESTSEIAVYFNRVQLPIKIQILDISIEGCNLSFDSLPAGLKDKSELVLKVKLGVNTSPLEFDVKAEVLKIKECEGEFRIVVSFELETKNKKLLIDYIAKRQMALIREFKGLENAK